MAGPAFLFDLDGTLMDSVYHHVLAWQEALARDGIHLSVWRIHRRIGMSGGLLANAMLRETGRPVTPEDADLLRRLTPRPTRSRLDAGAAVARGDRAAGHAHRVRRAVVDRDERLHRERGAHDRAAGVPDGVPVVTRDQVAHAKPDPDLFLAAAEQLGVDIEDSVVVGDSVWDLLAARRARALGVGLLSGGYGEEELARAGAYRVYEDPADLLAHLDEVGVRAPGT